jgi:UDP-2-acetamido-3-amino-2,3-dideoxy-glucuronate N-acetyltransferase
MSAPSNVFVHAMALCESDSVGAGTRIWAFAHVMAGATIGKGCNICDHAFVEAGAVIGDGVVIKNGVMIWNGVVIEDDVFVGPGALFTNDRFPRSRNLASAAKRYEDESSWLAPIRIGKGASIGAGAVICPGLTIGAFAMVAAGAVVTRDVPPKRLVAGNPARVVGWVDEAGDKSDND